MEPNNTCPPHAGGGRCELEENLEILRGIPAFSGIPIQRLRLYAYLGKRVCFSPGDFLFRQGDAGDRGYIVVCGAVQVIREFPDHSVLLNEFKEGEFFGGLALLSKIRRLFSVRAVTPLECLTWDRDSFQKLLLQFPEVAIQILDMMIQRVIQMEDKLLSTMSNECVFG